MKLVDEISIYLEYIYSTLKFYFFDITYLMYSHSYVWKQVINVYYNIDII